MGIDVVDLGFFIIFIVEMAVMMEEVGVGIVIIVSYNLCEWNVFKFFNDKGEFILKVDGEVLLEIIDSGDIEYVGVEEFGKVLYDDCYIKWYVKVIFDLFYVDVVLVKSKKYRVVVDCINSFGLVVMLLLFKVLGCEVELFNKKFNGCFVYNLELLFKYFKDLSWEVVELKVDFGVVVDLDVDCFVFVCEDGSMFGEEYILVVVVDYILQQ